MLDIARANRTISRRARTLSWRNQRLMQVKNETVSGYLTDLPWIVRREILSFGFIVLMDPRSLIAIPRLLRALPWAVRKRQALRRAIARTHSGARGGS
jgi:hypothetical protein